jgi:hypothetical protein
VLEEVGLADKLRLAVLAEQEVLEPAQLGQYLLAEKDKGLEF